MEPLSTFFRINPALLFQNLNTPRSQTSSSFSSPSFADHQTGLKVYCESPASLTNAQQDNPLFEGFPPLTPSNRKVVNPPNEACAESAPAPGSSPKLQEQLHHLLSVLQRALDLHGADGLLDDMAPQLADELEAVARRLKQKEREVALERQLRAKVQLALTGAEATIRKLRATPSRRTPANGWSARWRCNDAAAPSPTAAGRRSSACDESQMLEESRGAGIRDSVCRQLLQSPSSSMSPLSWTGPSPTTTTPMCVVDDTSMASPKELPTDQQKLQHRQQLDATGSPCEHVLIPTGLSRVRQVSCPSSGTATSSSFHPPLYNWMKAVLASAAKQEDGMLCGCGSSSDVAGRASYSSSAVNSPATVAFVGNGLAGIIRAALSNTRTPLIYGSPLYKRIQRLLAEQHSPSSLREDALQSVATLPCAEHVSSSGRSEGGRMHTPQFDAPKPASWDPEDNTEYPLVSNRLSDTSSSCNTPIVNMRDDIAALPFRSSVSPFGPTLRERYASRACTATSDAGRAQRPEPLDTATSKPAVGCDDTLPLQRPKHAEAAELVAELGLDLQLDPITAGNISNLEVLEHVERWAREQFIAAKRALEASREGILEDEGSAGSVARNYRSAQAQTDIAIRTEAVGGVRPGREPVQLTGAPTSIQRSHGAFSNAARGRQLTHKHKPKGKVPASSMACSQLVDLPMDVAANTSDAPAEDAGADVCALSRNDQSKRSALMGGNGRRDDAASLPEGGTRRDSGIVEGFSRLACWAQKRRTTSESVGHFTRRGIFRVIAHRSSPDSGTNQSACDPSCEGSSIQSSPDEAVGITLGQLEPSPHVEIARGDSEDSVARVARAAEAMQGLRRPGPQPCRAGRKPPGRIASPRKELLGDVLFTRGTSASGCQAKTHSSRVFSLANGGCNGPDDATALGHIHRFQGIVGQSGPCTSARAASMGSSGDCGASTSRESILAVGALSSRCGNSTGVATKVTEVIFTPENVRPNAKSIEGNRVVLPFRLEEEEEDDETADEGDMSARTLSSISSVSIISSEPDTATNGDNEVDLQSARCLEPEPAIGNFNRQNACKPPFSQYLCGFFKSLMPCTHRSEVL